MVAQPTCCAIIRICGLTICIIMALSWKGEARCIETGLQDGNTLGIKTWVNTCCYGAFLDFGSPHLFPLHVGSSRGLQSGFGWLSWLCWGLIAITMKCKDISLFPPTLSTVVTTSALATATAMPTTVPCQCWKLFNWSGNGQMVKNGPKWPKWTKPLKKGARFKTLQGFTVSSLKIFI